ncbi:unnamed protein product [Schistosoma margrebowiei]|uniref:Uncharacterized protein n=1 Tax=Schistosoma margrebowiei TaxID=48269 RepID=A0A183N6B1_9TREM|nr:unnamed protein product [Schistosoma margrebowiei]
MSTVSTRATFNIIKRNVRKMWDTGRTNQVATEMRRNTLAVLRISETYWTKSSHEEDNVPHTQRVALILFKVARNALVGWESYGSGIKKASFNTNKNGITMNAFQSYAPTDDSNDDDKDQFYNRQQSTIANCTRMNLAILMGDLNAKVEIDNTRYEDIIRRHGLAGSGKQKLVLICKSVCVQQLGH